MLNKKPVMNEEMTLSRWTYSAVNGLELHAGFVGTVTEITEDGVRLDFVVNTLPGNNPDAVEVDDYIRLEFDELVDYIEGYHWIDPVDEDQA